MSDALIASETKPHAIIVDIGEADAIGNFFVLWNRDFITLPVGGRLLEIFTREQAEKIVDLLEELS